MSWSQQYPNTFDGVTQTNTVLKNTDNETKRIYTVLNALMAANGHAHTASGSDGAKISALDLDDFSIADVRAFGAVGDGTTDDATAIQAAVDSGAGVIYFPAGTYAVSTVTIKNACTIYGDGLYSTKIYPITGYDTFIIANDFITIRDMGFIAKNNQSGVPFTQQSTIEANCIKILASDNNPAFLRAMEGLKFNRLYFLNIKGAGIYAEQAFRESFITECRFVGMGDVDTGYGPIHCDVERVSPAHTADINNVLISGNMFYRFATPSINMIATTELNPSYSEIRIENNLIHNQTLDMTTNPEGQPVYAEDTDNIVVKDVNGIVISHNFITAVHPNHPAIYIVNQSATQSHSISVFGNRFSIDTDRLDVSYPGTGSAIHVVEPETVIVFGNNFYSGQQINDIKIVRAAGSPSLEIFGNTSEAAAPLTFSLPTSYIGMVENYGDAVFTQGTGTQVGIGTVTPLAMLHVNGDFLSAGGTAAAPGVKVGDVNSGLYLVSDNILGFSTAAAERGRISAAGLVLLVPMQATTATVTAATPTVSSGQVGFGTTTSSTVGLAGGASALPANPTGYLTINIGGTAYKTPYYAS